MTLFLFLFLNRRLCIKMPYYKFISGNLLSLIIVVFLRIVFIQLFFCSATDTPQQMYSRSILGVMRTLPLMHARLPLTSPPWSVGHPLSAWLEPHPHTVCRDFSCPGMLVLSPGQCRMRRWAVDWPTHMLHMVRWMLLSACYLGFIEMLEEEGDRAR